MDALDSSHYTAYWRDRQEQAFAILEVTNQPGHFEVIQFLDPAATACSHRPVMLTPTMIPGRKLRAYVHIHAAKLLEYTSCPGNGNDSTTGYAPVGMSDSDFVYMQNLNQMIRDNFTLAGWSPVPFYIMDPEYIYRQPPDQPADFSRDFINARYWAAPGRCKWVRPTASQVPSIAAIAAYNRQLPSPMPRP